jgi:hypothetical protein
MQMKQFLSETVAMHPQYWSRVVRVSSTNPIPYASGAMVGGCHWARNFVYFFAYLFPIRLLQSVLPGFVYKRPRLDLVFLLLLLFSFTSLLTCIGRG